MRSKSSYDSRFFSLIGEKSLNSAAEVLPHVLKLSGARSVVDLGCGEGAWLRVAGQLGVGDVYGVDGEYIDPARLLIDREQFRAADLRHVLFFSRRYELAICVEVAEHLPPSSASSLVETLVSLAPVVLFSAAIPGQGGTQHLNEQWPSYWQSHFAGHGYKAVDCIRPLVWSNPHVAWWYAQNLIVYAHASWLVERPEIKPELEAVRSLVHPEHWKAKLDYLRIPEDMSLRELLRGLPRAVIRSLRRSGGGSAPSGRTREVPSS